ELRRLLAVERRQRQGGRVLLRRAPRRAAVEELHARGADDQDGGAGQRVRESSEQVEKRGRSPMEVLDGQDRQALLPERGNVEVPCILEPLRHLAGPRRVGESEPDRACERV